MLATTSSASPLHLSFAAMTARFEAKREALAALIGDGSQAVALDGRYDREDPSIVAGVQLLTRDPSCRSQWRLTYFTADGPSGHLCFATLTEVVLSLMSTPAVLATGQVDAWSGTARWAAGLEALAACARVA